MDGIRFTVRHAGGAFPAHIRAFGTHMVYSALAAAAVGLELGMTSEEIAAGIGAYRTVGNRAKVIRAGELTIISDCYNANPNSMRAALDSLVQLEGRRVCVLGDMLELGDETVSLHCGVGEYAAQKGVELIIGCGTLGRHIAEGARASGGETMFFQDKAALISRLGDIIRPGDCVLVKASHFMAFEDIVEKMVALYTV